MATNENAVVVSSQQERPTVFMDLAYELRMMIWKYSLTRRYHRLDAAPRSFHRLPLLAQVCREARGFVLQSTSPFLIPVSPTDIKGEGIMMETWFNRQSDVLKLTVWEPDWPFWMSQFFGTVETISMPLESLVSFQKHPSQLVRDIAERSVFPRLKVLLVIVRQHTLLWPARGHKPVITRRDIYDNRFDIAWDDDGICEDELSGDSPPPGGFLSETPEAGSITPRSSTASPTLMPASEFADLFWEDISQDPMFYEVAEKSTKLFDVHDPLENKDPWGWGLDDWKLLRWGLLRGWTDRTRSQVEDEFMKVFRPLYVQTEGGDADSVSETLGKDHPWVKNKFQQLPKIRPAMELSHP